MRCGGQGATRRRRRPEAPATLPANSTRALCAPLRLRCRAAALGAPWRPQWPVARRAAAAKRTPFHDFRPRQQPFAGCGWRGGWGGAARRRSSGRAASHFNDCRQHVLGGHLPLNVGQRFSLNATSGSFAATSMHAHHLSILVYRVTREGDVILRSACRLAAGRHRPLPPAKLPGRRATAAATCAGTLPSARLRTLAHERSKAGSRAGMWMGRRAQARTLPPPAGSVR